MAAPTQAAAMSSGPSTLNPSSVEQADVLSEDSKASTLTTLVNRDDSLLNAASTTPQGRPNDSDPSFQSSVTSNGHTGHNGYDHGEHALGLQLVSSIEEDWMATKSLSGTQLAQAQDLANNAVATRQSPSASSQDEPITPLAEQPPQHQQQLFETSQWEPSVEAAVRVRPSVRAKLQERMSSGEGTPPTLRKTKPVVKEPRSNRRSSPKTKVSPVLAIPDAVRLRPKRSTARPVSTPSSRSRRTPTSPQEPTPAPIRTTRATELRNRQIQSAKHALDRKLARERTLDGIDPGTSPATSPQLRRRPRSQYDEQPKTLPSVDTQLKRSGSAKARKALKGRKTKTAIRREASSLQSPQTTTKPIVSIRTHVSPKVASSPASAVVNGAISVPSPPLITATSARSVESPSPTQTQQELEAAVRTPSPRGRQSSLPSSPPAGQQARQCFHSPQSRGSSPTLSTSPARSFAPAISLEDVSSSRRPSTGLSWVSRRVPQPPALDQPTIRRSRSLTNLLQPDTSVGQISHSVGASPQMGKGSSPTPPPITPPPPFRNQPKHSPSSKPDLLHPRFHHDSSGVESPTPPSMTPSPQMLRKPKSVRDLVVTPPNAFQSSPVAELSLEQEPILEQAESSEQVEELQAANGHNNGVAVVEGSNTPTPPLEEAAELRQTPTMEHPKSLMTLTPPSALKRKPKNREQDSSVELLQLRIGGGHFNNVVDTVTSASLAKQVDMKFRKGYSINTAGARSSREVLRRAIRVLRCREYNYRCTHHCCVYWCGGSWKDARWVDPSPGSWISRIPGLYTFARKVPLAQVLNRMVALFPQEYGFVPRTWNLPLEMDAFIREDNRRKTKAPFKERFYIAKPDDGAHGDGIFLTTTAHDARFKSLRKAHVVQDYIADPLLIEGYKFDLRLYVLVTSLDPLKVYIHREGMARLCTTLYQPPTVDNIDKTYMHLTNFTLNKKSDNYVHTAQADSEPHDGGTASDNNATSPTPQDTPKAAPKRKLTVRKETSGKSKGKVLADDPGREDGDDGGSKRLMTGVFDKLLKAGRDVPTMWARVEGIVAKTMLALVPVLSIERQKAIQTLSSDRPIRPFQVVGFDVLVDNDLQPYLIEINANPSLRIDFDLKTPDGRSQVVPSPVDEDIKVPAVTDALAVLVQEDLELERRGRTVIPAKTMSAAQQLYLTRQKRLKDARNRRLGRSRPSTPPGSPEKKKRGRKKSKDSEMEDPIVIGDLYGYCDLAESFSGPYKRHQAINILLKNIFQTYSSAATRDGIAMSSSAFRIFIRHCGREEGQAAMIGSACDLLYLKTLREFGLQRGQMSFEAFCHVAIRAAKQFQPATSKRSLVNGVIAMVTPTAIRKSIVVERCLVEDEMVYL
eukprot:m.206947 g.206947  ORF g.206947 m.206947 type:complete len:1367 (-) comp17118_c0_seq4:80-4180(-)